MAKKSGETLKGLLASCMKLREDGAESFVKLGTETGRIARELAAADREVETAIERREKIKRQWDAKHELYEKQIAEINAAIARAQKEAQSASGREDLSKSEALLLIKGMLTSVEENLMLDTVTQQRLRDAMAHIEAGIARRGGKERITSIPVPPVPGDCSGCKGGCKDSCYAGCKGGCFNSCEGGCMGACKESCMGCTGACMGACKDSCMGGCTGGCLGPIKAGK